MFLEPAVQHVGVHAMLPGYGRNGGSWLLARRHQFSFELAGVGAVGAPDRISGKVGGFEHGVHDGLRERDLARCETSIQDEFTGRLRMIRQTVVFLLRISALDKMQRGNLR